MTTDIKVKVTPSHQALQKALACAILSERTDISPHTRAALRSIAQRLLEGEAVSWDEYKATAYAYFASTVD